VVYNVQGQVVATLVNEYRKAGSYSVDFNAANLASGMYMYRLHVGDVVLSKKLMLLK
jgi:hypothetical protein